MVLHSTRAHISSGIEICVVAYQQLYDRQLPVLCSQEQRRCVACGKYVVSFGFLQLA
jgi:hypothetical protein